MDQAITIGLDIAKSVFQVHGVDEAGESIIRRQLRRSQVLPFFAKLGPVLLVWKPVPRCITGRGRSPNLAMRCG